MLNCNMVLESALHCFFMLCDSCLKLCLASQLNSLSKLSDPVCKKNNIPTEDPRTQFRGKKYEKVQKCCTYLCIYIYYVSISKQASSLLSIFLDGNQGVRYRANLQVGCCRSGLSKLLFQPLRLARCELLIPPPLNSPCQ